jgi:uncharacterized protein (DUF3084 family)
LQLWTDTNWTLIVSIIAGSAALAYLGDVLGLKYGKRRISLFGLRPKYTSRLITALTGVLISVAVLTVLSFFSQSVRTALFGMKVLQTQLSSLYVQLQNSRADSLEAQNELTETRLELTENRELLHATALSLDMTRFDLGALRNDRDILAREKSDLDAAVAFLREESEELRRDLDMMRLEEIAVQANSLLAQRAVLPGTPRAEVRKILLSLEEAARAAVDIKRAARHTPGAVAEVHWGMSEAAVSSDVELVFDPAELSEIESRVSDSPERFYVRVLAAENITVDGEVRVRFESGRSYLLYDDGETIFRRLVGLESENSGFNAEDALRAFLRELKNTAIRNGVEPDPATNSVGSLGGEDFFEVVEQLKIRRDPVFVSAVASGDICTEGPVRVRIVLE